MFKKVFSWNWLRENIALIVLIPTLIGGVWQVLALMSIGTAYIRFFSISQVVADGLIILLLLLIVILMFQLSFYDPIEKNKADYTADEKLVAEKSKVPSIGAQYTRMIVIVIITGIALAYMWHILFDENLRYDTPVGYLFVVVFSIVLVLRSLHTIIPIIVKVHKLKVDVDKIIDSEITKSIFSILIFSALFASLFVIDWFHHAFFLSTDMKNQSDFLAAIQHENPGMKVYNIRYFNDRYIFVELIPFKGESKILVKEFSSFFIESDALLTK